MREEILQGYDQPHGRRLDLAAQESSQDGRGARQPDGLPDAPDGRPGTRLWPSRSAWSDRTGPGNLLDIGCSGS
jgi:hypothetical protein